MRGRDIQVKSTTCVLQFSVATRAMQRPAVRRPRLNMMLRLILVDFFIWTFQRRIWGRMAVVASMTQERAAGLLVDLMTAM